MNRNKWMKMTAYFLATVTLAVQCPIQTGLCAVQAQEETEVGSEYEYVEINPGSIMLTGYFGTEEDVVIPEVIDGCLVLYIGTDAFSGNMLVHSITIPDSVTVIAEGAFADCSALETVRFGANVYSIPSGVFSGSQQLSAIEVDTQNTAYLSRDGVLYEKDEEGQYRLFCYPTGREEAVYEVLETIDGIPVTEVAEYAFSSCGALTEVTIPDSVRTIGEGAFSGSAQLEYVGLPAGLEVLAERIFSGCSSLTEAVIPDCVTEVGKSAFMDCVSLTMVRLPEGLVEIHDMAFYGCSALAEIVIPNGVTAVGESAFDYCSTLSRVTLPDGLVRIDTRAFAYCLALADIELPESVTELGDGAFTNCTSLREIVLLDGITSINKAVFSRCSALQTVTMTKNVTQIYQAAFANCTSLKTVEYYGTRSDREQITYIEQFPDTNTAFLNAEWIYMDEDTDTTIPSTITSSVYTVGSTYLSRISAGTTVSALTAGLNEKAYIRVYRADGRTQITGSTLVGTGCIVQLLQDSVVRASRTVVVTGDVNGDGRITAADYVNVKFCVLGRQSLSGAYGVAADVNGDNGITASDYVNIKFDVLGKNKITPR